LDDDEKSVSTAFASQVGGGYDWLISFMSASYRTSILKDWKGLPKMGSHLPAETVS
jgi:hypothetical protein